MKLIAYTISLLVTFFLISVIAILVKFGKPDSFLDEYEEKLVD